MSTKGRLFTIQIRFTRTIDIGRLGVFVRGEGAGGGNFPDASEVQSATQALNVLVQHGPSMVSVVVVLRAQLLLTFRMFGADHTALPQPRCFLLPPSREPSSCQHSQGTRGECSGSAR